MIWFFGRAGEKITYEICRDDARNEFLLVMTSGDGQKRVERIGNPTELIEKSSEQMRRLHEDGWKVG